MKVIELSPDILKGLQEHLLILRPAEPDYRRLYN